MQEPRNRSRPFRRTSGKTTPAEQRFGASGFRQSELPPIHHMAKHAHAIVIKGGSDLFDGQTGHLGAFDPHQHEPGQNG